MYIVLDIIFAFISFSVFLYGMSVKNEKFEHLYYLVVIICSCVTVRKESKILVLLFIMLMALMWIKKDDIKYFQKILNAQFVAAISLEIISLVYSLKIIELGEGYDEWIGSACIDLVFVIALFVWFATTKIKKVKIKNLAIVFATFELIFIGLLCVNSLEITKMMQLNESDIKNGSDYMICSTTSEDVVTVTKEGCFWQQNENKTEQLFSFTSTDEEGFYNISNYEDVYFDISHGVFESGNSLCFWEKNDAVNQKWKFIDQDDGTIKIVSHDENLAMAFNGDISFFYITSDVSDVNQFFKIKKNVTGSEFLMRRIIEGGVPKTICVWVGIQLLALILVVGVLIFLKRYTKYLWEDKSA